MNDQRKKELHIKNMVCPRCIMVVDEVLQELGFEVYDVELGKAVVAPDDSISKEEINRKLGEYGFELLEGQNQKEVEEVKTLLLDYMHKLEEAEKMPKVSKYLAGKLHQNYSSISSKFSDLEGITIEKYLIHLKIERVKELLSYDEMTLGEIAYKLNYSSVSHLSNQFKQITGMSVTDYKKARNAFRKPYDGVDK